MKSWGNCTKYHAKCGGDCIGCTLQQQHDEPFPVFAALMNAVHLRNVKVRYLTNDYAVPTCLGKITPMDWMALNGVQIRMYTTTTFMHAKTMIIDKGKKTLVSSVNFSKTSFTRNREAGVIISDCQCEVQDLYHCVFESDWEKAYNYKPSEQHFSQTDLEFITSTEKIPLPDFNVEPIPGAYVTSMNTYSGVTVNKGYTAPDNARTTFMEMLGTARSSLRVHIYQITDTGICDKILDLYNDGVNVSLLVASYVVNNNEYKQAQVRFK